MTGNDPERERAQVRKAYAAVAAEYDERIAKQSSFDEVFTSTESEFLFSKIRPDDEILDMGCGTGRYTIPLAERGKSVTGLDMSPEMLVQARRKLAERGLSADLHEGDMARLPFAEASFDVVVSMLAFMHIPRGDRQQVFCEAARVLKPGGRMLMGVRNSVYERIFRGDRFAAMDVTDVESEVLILTQTRGGADMIAPWHSFSPDELSSLTAIAGLSLTHLRGNSPISAWLADGMLADPGIGAVMRRLEHVVGDIPPFSHLGVYLLAEAVKPMR